MKKIILTVLAAGMTTVSFCQKSFILSHQDKRGFFAVSAGGSLPVGQFASSTPDDKGAGMARRGVAFSLSGGVRLVGPVGLMVRAEQHRNGVQAQSLLIDGFSNGTVDAGNWSTTTFMGGPYVHLPIGRFSINTRLMAGQAQATMPTTSLTAPGTETGTSVETSGSKSTALALGGGLAVQYRLGRSISLQLAGDYTQSRFTFSGLTSTTWTNTGRAQSSYFTGDRTVGAVSATAGIVILFGDCYRPF